MKQTKEVLKSYFETGDKPTQAQFADLIDSMALEDTITTSMYPNIAGLTLEDIGKTINIEGLEVYNESPAQEGVAGSWELDFNTIAYSPVDGYQFRHVWCDGDTEGIVEGINIPNWSAYNTIATAVPAYISFMTGSGVKFIFIDNGNGIITINQANAYGVFDGNYNDELNTSITYINAEPTSGGIQAGARNYCLGVLQSIVEINGSSFIVVKNYPVFVAIPNPVYLLSGESSREVFPYVGSDNGTVRPYNPETDSIESIVGGGIYLGFDNNFVVILVSRDVYLSKVLADAANIDPINYRTELYKKVILQDNELINYFTHSGRGKGKYYGCNVCNGKNNTPDLSAFSSSYMNIHEIYVMVSPI